MAKFACVNGCGRFYARKDVAKKHADISCEKTRQKAKNEMQAMAKCFVESCTFRTNIVKVMETHAINEHLDLFM